MPRNRYTCELARQFTLVLPKRITAHQIDRARVSPNAIDVIKGLRDAGFDAYLVGGCVRDLLLAGTPKDFDVATSATPEQVREVFARVRLVGRRFRIAHVRMRREIIEVSTFRRAVGVADQGHGEHLSERGVILRDNVYGGIDEDAFRRDFTINALYYDPVDDVVFDYCKAMADVKTRTLRLIGDPVARFREDPVRMLRAIRFAAKLGLDLHPATEKAIAPMREMLTVVPPARLFDEFGKLFLGGYGEPAFELLRTHKLTKVLFPLLALGSQGETFARLALANTDQRLREGKPVTPGFLLAAFLWHEYVTRLEAASVAAGDQEGREAVATALLATQQATVAIPRRHSYFVRDVWRLQPRLELFTARSVESVLEDRRMRAGYDFLLLRVAANDAPAELGEWWTRAQTMDFEVLRQQLPKGKPRRPRRRRGGKAANRARLAPTPPPAASTPSQ